MTAAKHTPLDLDELSESNFSAVVTEIERLREVNAELVKALRKCLDNEAPQMKWIDARKLLRELGEDK